MLQDEITSSLRRALKERDELRLAVLRMLAAAIHNREIERRPAGGVPLSETDVVQVIRAELKKRHDAALQFAAGGRPELAEREESEAAILQTFLPPELKDAELEAMVAEGMETLNVSSTKGFGKLMGWVMERVGGRASGDRVSALIKSKLSGTCG